MTREDIIRIAREAGLLRSGEGWTEPHRWGLTEFEKFAALVAEAEREACALAVEQAGVNGMGTLAAAAMIRQRGEK